MKEKHTDYAQGPGRRGETLCRYSVQAPLSRAVLVPAPLQGQGVA